MTEVIRAVSIVRYVSDWVTGNKMHPFSPKDHYLILGVVDYFIREFANYIETQEEENLFDINIYNSYLQFRSEKGSEWGLVDDIYLPCIYDEYEYLNKPIVLFYIDSTYVDDF